MDDPLKAAVPKPCCVCDAPGGKHCTKCKSRHYCSKKCQLVDWNEGGHKAQCRQMATEFSDRLLDELMPAKLKIREAHAIVEDVAYAAGLKVPARLSAIRATAVVKASAPNDDASDWLGTCPICLDQLPIKIEQQTFCDCCCMRLCTACAVKCWERDDRCPFCRTERWDSSAEWVRRVQKHADKGNPEAQVMLGSAYREGMHGLKINVKRAFELCEKAAAQGHASAQGQLALLYQLGQGVKVDFKTAALWYRRAAEQGHPRAQFNLGAMFAEGNGVAQSHEEAVEWYGLAAAQGDEDALYKLGVCYAKGRGVVQDYDEGMRIIKRAAAAGHAGAAALVKLMALQGF